ELRRLVAVDPIADGNDRIEVVKLHLASDLPPPFSSNYFHFGNSCLSVQLSRFKNVFQVLVDRRNLDREKFRQRLLPQPHCFLLEENIHLHRTVRRGVKQELVLIAHTLIPVASSYTRRISCSSKMAGWGFIVRTPCSSMPGHYFSR